ncbi:hypothetical protein, partial [Klebsiella quasipneumoniae]|uniref:hypothetical protein n=2 Tax=Klebsiella quasipneumoniae TaxID=1463165 RepID=UPI001C9A9473
PCKRSTSITELLLFSQQLENTSISDNKSYQPVTKVTPAKTSGQQFFNQKYTWIFPIKSIIYTKVLHNIVTTDKINAK